MFLTNLTSFLFILLIILRRGSSVIEEADELKDCLITSSENKTFVNCKVMIKSQKEIILLNPEEEVLDEKRLLLDLKFSVLSKIEANSSLDQNTSTSNRFRLLIQSITLRKVKSADVPNVYKTKIKPVYSFLLKINTLKIQLSFNHSVPLGHLLCNASDLSHCRGTVRLDSHFFNSTKFGEEIVQGEKWILGSLGSSYLIKWKGRTEYLQIEINDAAEHDFYQTVLEPWTRAIYPLESLSFANSKLHKITTEFQMPKLSQLHHLDLSNCTLTENQLQLNSFLQTPDISHVDLSANKLKTIPNSLLHLNNLRVLHLQRNTFTDPFFNLSNLVKPSFRNLEELNLNALPLLEDDLIHLQKLGQLKILLLQNCFLSHLPKPLTFPYSLLMIDLSFNNLITFSTENFQNSGKIEMLDLSHNTLTLNKHGKELIHLKNAVHLKLSGNEISHLPFKLLNHLPKLLVLELRRNKIQSWSKQLLSITNISRSLDLSENRITEITKSMTQDFESLKEVRLAENPFDCGSCELDSFQSWTQNTSVILPDLLHYSCQFPLSMVDFPVLNATLNASCLPHFINLWLVVALPIFLVFSLLFLIIGVVYKYQDSLHMFGFSLFQYFCQKDKQENPKLFDAFISYSSKDEKWVKEFTDELEKTPPFYNLCLHNRNFVIGAPVQHQIIDSIECSRRLLFVLSKSFIDSQWCGWELKMAQHQLFETGKSNIILIQIEDLNEKRLPKSLQHLIKTRQLLLWPNREGRRPLFYAKLRSYLGSSETAEGVRLQQLA